MTQVSGSIFTLGVRSETLAIYLAAVFLLNELINCQRLSELDVDTMLEKAIYGTGFIN